MMVFLNQGSRLAGTVSSIDASSIQVASPTFGDLILARSEIQGIAFDPKLDRLVGASVEHDRLRLRTGKFLNGIVTSLQNGKVIIELTNGTVQEVDIADVGGVLLKRPLTTETDATSYVRMDLVDGQRLLGFVAQWSGLTLR